MTDTTNIAEQMNDEIVSLFSRDVIDKGKGMMAETARIYGDPAARAIHENTAQNYIYELAGVNFDDKPVTPQLHAAAKLMSFALALMTTAATSDVLAAAVQEIGSLGKRLEDSRKMASRKRVEQDEERDSDTGLTASEVVNRLPANTYPFNQTG